MRTAGSRWTIALEQSDGIDFALYVRDVLGIRGVQDQDLPPVDPAPTAGRSTSATDDRAAAEAWSSWWSNLLRMRRPGHGSVALLRPALPDLAAGLRDSFAEWWQERNRRRAGDLPTRELLSDLPSLVAEAGVLLRRPDPDFALVLTEVPVAEPVWVQVAPDHVLISRAALDDSPSVRRQLLQIIERLG